MRLSVQAAPGRLLAAGLALAALAAVLLLSWGDGGDTRVAADTTPVPGKNLDFSLVVDVDSNGTDDCDTRASTGGIPAKCPVPPSAAFTLKVYLDSLPNKIDLPTPPNTPTSGEGYNTFDLHVTYAGVTSKDNPSTSAWPDCDFPVSTTGPGFVRWGC